MMTKTLEKKIERLEQRMSSLERNALPGRLSISAISNTQDVWKKLYGLRKDAPIKTLDQFEG